MSNDHRYQLMPALDSEARAALKADIAERGVLVAVEVDEGGAILDGHHRVELWTELRSEGVIVSDYPMIVRDGWTEQQKRTHVRQLNLSRRHLSQEQRRQLIAAQLAEVPEASNRQVARDLGVSHHTVEGIRSNLEVTGQIAQSDVRQGADGRTINTANIGSNPPRPPIINNVNVPARPTVASFAPPADPPAYEEPGIQVEEVQARPTPLRAVPEPQKASPSNAIPPHVSAVMQQVMDAPEVQEATARANLSKAMDLVNRNLLVLGPELAAHVADPANRILYDMFIGRTRTWLDTFERSLSAGLRAVK